MFQCEVRETLAAAQVDDLMALYADEWWTRDRTRADVERMLADSDLLFVGTEAGSESLVGFARVLTDHTYVALVLDVIVAPAYRGRGLGSLLVESICSAPQLRSVERFELTCQPDHIPFYRNWGFTESVGNSRLMRRSTNPSFSDAAAQQAHRAGGAGHDR